MRKKTTWAASVVRKQLETCCQLDTISHSTLERDDLSESFELPAEIHISSPIKDLSFPCLFRRKSFSASHVKNHVTTSESLIPHRKSVESALPLCAGSSFRPRTLQDARSSKNVVFTPAVATRLPTPPPPPLSVPPGMEAPEAKTHHKSGPLPRLRRSFNELEMERNLPPEVKFKRYLSGPLPTIQREPMTASSSPSFLIAKRNYMLGRWNSFGKPSLLGGGPSPTSRFTKVKSSAQALFPAAATSKLSDLMTQRSLKKAAQLAKVASVPDRKGSRGSRASRVDCNLCPKATKTKLPLPKAVINGASSLGSREDGVQSANLGSETVKDVTASNERDRIRAAVKIQAAIRGYRARRRFAKYLSGELTDEEAEEVLSISTRMSKTNPQKLDNALGPRARRMEQMSKSWNGSLRTAQDCEAILKGKREAAMKRERAMEYASSRQKWKTSRSPSAKTPALIVDNTFPDKSSWVWNWLERTVKMGSNKMPSKVFDNDMFDIKEPVSESVSVNSTVEVYITEVDSATDMGRKCPMTYPWPLSLRQQHAAGLWQSKASPATPSPLNKHTHGTPERSQLTHSELKRHHQSKAVSTLAESCDTSQMSKPRFGIRKLRFAEDDEKQNYDGESVGSCPGLQPGLNHLSSPCANPKPRSQGALQLRKTYPDTLREAITSNPQTRRHSQEHRAQMQVAVELSTSDSAGTTAASLRRPFWRP